MSDAWELARHHIKKAQRKQKAIHDRHSKEVPLRVGDRVFLHVPAAKQGKAHKFARPFRGPYRVVELYENGADIRPVDRPRADVIRVALNRLRTCPTEIRVPGEQSSTVQTHAETLVDDPPGEEELPRDVATTDGPVKRDLPTAVSSSACDPERKPHSTSTDITPLPGGKWAGRLRRRRTIEAEVVSKGGEM